MLLLCDNDAIDLYTNALKQNLTSTAVDELEKIWQGNLSLQDLYCINRLHKGEYRAALATYVTCCQLNAEIPADVHRWFVCMTRPTA